jgi:hypothetical protein
MSPEALDRRFNEETKKRRAKTLARVASAAFTKRARRAHRAQLAKAKVIRKEGSKPTRQGVPKAAVSSHVDHATVMAQLTAAAAQLGLGGDFITAITAAAAGGPASVAGNPAPTAYGIVAAAPAPAAPAPVAGAAKAPAKCRNGNPLDKLRKNSHGRLLKVAGTHGRKGFNIFNFIRKVDPRFSTADKKRFHVRSSVLILRNRWTLITLLLSACVVSLCCATLSKTFPTFKTRMTVIFGLPAQEYVFIAVWIIILMFFIRSRNHSQ